MMRALQDLAFSEYLFHQQHFCNQPEFSTTSGSKSYNSNSGFNDFDLCSIGCHTKQARSTGSRHAKFHKNLSHING